MSDEKTSTTETTDRDFEIFKRSVNYWMDRFGLKGWKALFLWTHLEGDWAMATINTENRSVLLKYTTIIDCPIIPAENDPDQQGFHEVCEVLLDRFWNLTRKADPTSRIVTREDLQETVHSVVRMLENVVYYPRMWDTKGEFPIDKVGDTDAVSTESEEPEGDSKEK